MYYLAQTEKPFEQAVGDLEVAVKRNGFGILHVHDIGATLRGKGVTFSGECMVLEICDPRQAAKVLSIDIRLNMALPCRISVYSDNGLNKIGFIKPTKVLSALSDDADLAQVAQEVEDKMILMVDGAI